MRQLTLPIRTPAHHGFDNFVPGPNRMVLAQLRDLCDPPARGAALPPAVYLWGPPGCGKSHLLGALAVCHRDGGGRVARFGPDAALPWPIGGDADLLVFDSCDDLDDARQQAAFALFVDASSRGALVAAAGRMPPIDLPLRDDLRSRLGWGLVLALQPPAEADVRQLLDNEARRRGLVLSAEVAGFVLSRFARDPKSLIELLDRADEFALSRQRALTIPLIRQMLQQGAGAAG